MLGRGAKTLISATLVALLFAGSAARAADHGHTKAPHGGDRLPASKFFTMEPFVVPLVDKGQHRRQITLVVALELTDDSDREELQRLQPKFRDGMYQVLFKLLTFRTAEPRIPGKSVIKRKLQPVAKKVGRDMVKSLVVQQVIVEKRPG